MSEPWSYRLKGVTKEYGGRQVLYVGDLEIHSGEVFCFVGPTGSGKSTLLRLLALVESPTAGQFTLKNYTSPLYAQRQVTMVFQRPLMLAGSVRTNVECGLRLRHIRERSSKVQPVLDELKLSGIAFQSARTLSVGQTQLVGLARALVLEPDVLLLDEPTANLDPAHVDLVEGAVEKARKRSGATVIWATHNLFQARRMAHRIGLLLDGLLVEVCPPQDFFETPQDPRTLAFVKGKMVY